MLLREDISLTQLRIDDNLCRLCRVDETGSFTTFRAEEEGVVVLAVAVAVAMPFLTAAAVLAAAEWTTTTESSSGVGGP